MYLVTLGNYELSPYGLKERIAILILSYLAIEGETPRQRLADLMWPFQNDSEKRLGNLAEALRKLNRLDEHLVISKRGKLVTSIPNDLRDVLSNSSLESVKLYKGKFLDNIETSKRLELGEELNEWLFNIREKVSNHVLNIKLNQAERLAFEAKFQEAAKCLSGIDKFSEIAYQTKTTYERIHLIFLGAEQAEQVTKLEKEAFSFFDPGELRFFKHSAQARAYLRHNIVNAPESDHFRGRDDELKEMLELVKTKRLITIFGQAGLGKTGFAHMLLKAARGQSFAKDGLYLVYLEELTTKVTEQAILRKLLAELNPNLKKPEYSLEDAIAILGDKHILLVFDNIEQLTSQLSPLLKTLHQRCPNLRLLLTSRHLTKLQDETAFALSALRFPKTVKNLSLEDGKGFSAMALFMELAEKQGYPLEAKDLAFILKICQLIEGLPLGIHLSAGWLGSQTAQQISELLEINLDILSQGYSDNERHKSMKASLNYSLGLLEPAMLKSLINLAVFTGGFSGDAAQQIAQVSVFDLRAFIERSLLRFDMKTARYSFHPLLKRFLQERFIAQDTFLDLQTQHAFYYLSQLDSLFDENNNESDLLRLVPDSQEMLTAWRFACDHHWSQRLCHSTKALQRFANLSMQYDLGDDLLTYALSKTPTDNLDLQVILQINLSLFKWFKHDYEKAKELASKGLVLLEQSSIDEARQISLKRLGLEVLQVCHSAFGELGQALDTAKEVYDLAARTHPDSPAYVDALIALVLAEHEALGIADFAKLEQAEKLSRQVNLYHLPNILCIKGMLCLYKNNLAEAEFNLNKAESESERLNIPRWLLRSKMYKAELAIKKNQHHSAKSICLELIKGFDIQTHLSIKYETLQRLAIAETKLQEFECASRHFDEALSEVKRGGNMSSYLTIQVSRYVYLFKANAQEAKTLRYELEANIDKMDFPDRLLFQQGLENLTS